MAIREFDAIAPGKHFLVLLGKKRNLQFIKKTSVNFMSLKEAKALLQSDKCDAVIFHSLPNYFLPLLNSISSKKKVFWLGWGYDYYVRLLSPAYSNGLLLQKTKALLQQYHKREVLKRLIYSIKSFIKPTVDCSSIYQQNLIKRIDYFCPVIEPEYQIAKKLNPWFSAKYLCWNYGTVEDDLSDGNELFISGNNILIGNSATFENNHLDAFDYLIKNYDITGRKIIVPLSYGNEWYAKKVADEGRRLFGKNFIPLFNFLPKDEYLKLLDSCGHVFMYHLRQQALGNICIMMQKGAKVYLNRDNPLSEWFSTKKAHFENTDNTSGQLYIKKQLFALNKKEKIKNRQVILNHWGREIQRKRTQTLVSIALERD